MAITNADRLELEQVFELIRTKMEQGFFGSILVPMKFGKLGRIKIEEIVDIQHKPGAEG